VRVLQLHTAYRQPGGEDAVVRADRAALEAAGHEVRGLVVENPVQPAGAAATLAASVWNPAAAWRAAQEADAFRPDVAHVHNTWFAMSPSVLLPLHRRRIPTVMTVHNYRLVCANGLFLRDGEPCEKCLVGSPWNAARHRCYRGSRAASAVAAAGIDTHRRLATWPRLVDTFVALSDFARRRLLRANIPADRLMLGGNFVMDPGLREVPPSRSRDVLFVGRISNEKGLHVLLDAWRRTATAGLRLLVIGDGPMRRELETRTPPGVLFLGRVPSAEVMARLREARAVVIPSVWYEGQPLVALEAIAAGTPLVVSDIGGLPEVLGGSDAGWLVPPGDAAALSAVLARLGEDATVDRKGTAARWRYGGHFTPAAGTARLETAYAMATRISRGD